jgi:HSP20 family protein
MSARSAPKRVESFAVDVQEIEGAYRIFVNLPGVSRELVELSVEERTLEIIVSASEESGGEGRSLLQERRPITGTRKFVLPEVASEDGIEAALEKGVLTITVPKQVKKEPLKITVS